MENKSRIKIGIYGIGILMMGVIGISGALTAIGAHFPDASQTMIQNLISIPCLVVIPVTLIVGKLMDSVSKKLIALVGILCFLIGGFVPALMSSLTAILVLRGVLGVGIGVVQCVSSALVAENFEGPERDKVQGNLTSAQMLGICVMVFAGGWLADISWNFAFFVHLLGIISLVLCIVCIPNVKPSSAGVSDAPKQKAKLTAGSWIWALTMFVLFIGAQIYSIALSFIVDEKGLGTAAQSGNAMAFFAIGGFLLGLVFGRLAGAARDLTLRHHRLLSGNRFCRHDADDLSGSFPVRRLSLGLHALCHRGHGRFCRCIFFCNGDFHNHVRAEFRSVPLPVYRQSDICGTQRRYECKSDFFPAGSSSDGCHGGDCSDLGTEAEQKERVNALK